MSYIGLIEINVICIVVLLITLLQFKDSILRHLEERILGFTIIVCIKLEFVAPTRPAVVFLYIPPHTQEHLFLQALVSAVFDT